MAEHFSSRISGIAMSRRNEASSRTVLLWDATFLRKLPRGAAKAVPRRSSSRALPPPALPLAAGRPIGVKLWYSASPTAEPILVGEPQLPPCHPGPPHHRNPVPPFLRVPAAHASLGPHSREALARMVVLFLHLLCFFEIGSVCNPMDSTLAFRKETNGYLGVTQLN